MENKAFESFQERRKRGEMELKASIMSWAKAEACEDLTVGQIISLEKVLVPILNKTSRDAFDIGQVTCKPNQQ